MITSVSNATSYLDSLNYRIEYCRWVDKTLRMRLQHINILHPKHRKTVDKIEDLRYEMKELKRLRTLCRGVLGLDQ